MRTGQLRLLKLVVSLAVTFMALTGCLAGGGHTFPPPSAASPLQPTGTLLPPTPEPAAVPSPQPTAAPFTAAASQELSTTTPTLPGTTPGTAAAFDVSTNEYDFTAVSAGYDHACGLRSNGKVVCWGRGRNGETEPPETTFTSISAGSGYTCGIKTGGSVACWGIWDLSYGMVGQSRSRPRRPQAPEGVFKSISTSAAHACGIKADHTVVCWGQNYISAGDFPAYAGQATPPPGTFRSVSAGRVHSCGVTTNNLVVCWGAGYEGTITPQQGSFLSVSVGSRYICGLKTDYTVVCWGPDDYVPVPPTGEFSSVAAGSGHACGVRLAGELECWGYWLTDVAPQGKFLSVSVGENHRCAVRTEGAIACWGRDFGSDRLGLQSEVTCGVLPNRDTVCPGDKNYDVLAALHTDWVHDYDYNGSRYPCGNGLDGMIVCWDPYEETFVGPRPREVLGFSAGDDSACWLLPGGTVGCWGRIGSPAGTFQSIDVDEAGRGFACGVRTSGDLACWGDNGHDWGNVFPPEGNYKSVSLGFGHACAIKIDDAVVCWGAIGDDYPSRGVPPSGPFISLGGGGISGQCGIRPDKTLDCWGGLHALPGVFESVSVGVSRHEDFYCGVRADGPLACSGTGRYGETTPPEGKFQSVGAGWGHVCGVRVDGTVACWGRNADDVRVIGQAMPPAGRFLSVNAGRNYTCGIRTNHTLSCWGRVPAVLQNLSASIPFSVTEPEPTSTPGIRSLPLRDQLDLEMEKPGNLVANVGGDLGRIYRFVGMMTEAEREAMTEETQLYLEELGPPKGKASLHTYARIWLDLLEAFASPEKEFDDYYTISEFRLKVPFYVYLPTYLPPGFVHGGLGVSGGGGEYSTAWTIHFRRSSETYPQLERGQEEWITFNQSTNDQKGNPFREILDQIGGGHKIELPNLKEAGGLDARYWVGPTEYYLRDVQGQLIPENVLQFAWENPESDTFAHVISELSLEETLKVIRFLR